MAAVIFLLAVPFDTNFEQVFPSPESIWMVQNG